MNSAPLTQFKWINRSKKSTLVMIPGWATDVTIFDALDLEFNYLLPIAYDPETFETGLLSALRENNLNQISLLGWSMGGFVAAQFALNNSLLIDRCFLVSIREQYPKKDIDIIRQSLKSRRKGFLYNFYFQACSNNDWNYFKKTYFDTYVNKMNLEELLQGLDYLEQTMFPIQNLKNVKNISFIHGALDRIAPLEEANRIQKQLPNSKWICLPETGHIPFFNKEFGKYIDG